MAFPSAITAGEPTAPTPRSFCPQPIGRGSWPPGRINDVGGYAAVDMGPYTRRIHACRLLVQRAESGTRFTLEGETGLLEPDSHREILFPREIEARGLYVFKISFVIPDRDLAVYFREAQGLEAMARYVAAAGPQSSQKT